MNSISEQIALLRKEKGLTQEELAEKIGVSAQTISKWENGVTLPDILLLPIIADIFGITIDELYGNVKSVRNIEPYELPEIAYDELLREIKSLWRKDDDTSFSLEEEAREIKENLINNPDTQSGAIVENGGAVYVNSEYGIVFRKPTLKTKEILEDEQACELLTNLSDKTVRKVLMFLIENNTHSSTASSISAKCGIPTDEATKALDTLEKYGLVRHQDVDLGDETVKIYTIYAANRLLLVYMILRLANKLANFKDNYYTYCGTGSYWFL